MKLLFVIGTIGGTVAGAWFGWHPHLVRSPRALAAATQTSAQTLSTQALSAQALKYDPTAAYTQETVHGFTVLINAAVLQHPAETKAMQQELGSQLLAIARVMPAQPLSHLKTVRIWVEWEHQDGAATFHPSMDWLREHGYNPEKAGCIEISNTRKFVEWSRTAQPWMILHELAHAYHFLVLGDAEAGVHAAYQHAVKQALYRSVAYIQGGTRKAYALTNDKEYFAELSESYFGKNDFYPFTRSELKRYDPVGYQLMERAWGKPRSYVPR